MRPVREELDLHGMTVDEALPKIDEFLYAAYQGGLYRVWVIHGKGTGVLRREVGRYLANHPLVSSHSPAASNHGGRGATQVELSVW
jgi:DNA mismatch repair protein MutS2